MDKYSKSTDPIQQSLRDSKRQWNKEVTNLIVELIAVKQGINGKGSDKAGIPASSIKDPLPSEVSSYLEKIMSDFSDVSNGARSIINTQNEYSQNRRKSRKEALLLINRGLDKRASNKLSRLWSYVWKSPFGDKAMKLKTRLLRSTVDIEKTINEVELLISSSSNEDVLQGCSDFAFLINKIYSLYSRNLYSLLDYINGIQTGSIQPSSEEEKNTYQPKDTNDTILRNNVMNLPTVLSLAESLSESDEYLSKEDLLRLEEEYKDLYSRYEDLKISKLENDTVDNLLLISKNILTEIKNAFGISDQSDVYQTLDFLSKLPSEFEKEAGKSFSRYLKRTKLKMFSTEFNSIRLEISNLLNESGDTVNQIMDLLESNESSLDDIVDRYVYLFGIMSQTSFIMGYLCEFMRHNDMVDRKVNNQYINNLKQKIPQLLEVLISSINVEAK